MLSVIPVEMFDEVYDVFESEGLERFLSSDSQGLFIRFSPCTNIFDVLEMSDRLDNLNFQVFDPTVRNGTMQGYLCYKDNVNDFNAA